MSFARPATLEHALDHLADRPWCVLAGGTDLYPAHVGKTFNDPVLDISALHELRGIGPIGASERSGAGWRIGGLTRWADLIKKPLPPAFDGLKLAAREVGSVQIQNAGTIAGNLCNASPAADGVPPLLTLDAMVELTSHRGRRCLPLDRFITGYRKTVLATDELMTAIIIPENGALGASHFKKLGARKYLVISIAMAAVRLAAAGGRSATGARSATSARVTEASVALGACSPVAMRLPVLEQALVGAPLEEIGERVMPDHLDALQPIDDIRATADYRRNAALTLVRRSLISAASACR